MKAVFLRLGIVLLVGLLSGSGDQTKIPMHITSGFTPPVSTFYKMIFDEINRRYPKYQFTFEELSAERALILANKGINDGECCRIPNVIRKEYPNLIVVPYRIYSIKWVAFSTRPLPIKKWEDIKPYNTVILRGWKLAEKRLHEVNPASLQEVRTPEIMMNMLEKGHADVGVMGYMSGVRAIHNINAKNILYISEPLSTSPLYLLLNNKHRDELPELAAIIKTLDDDGTLDQLNVLTMELLGNENH